MTGEPHTVRVTNELMAIAARVVAEAGRDKPADAVLRNTLRRMHGLWGGDSRAVSRAVFAYYRWLGWLERGKPVPLQVQQALELASSFAEAPQGFSDGELMERTVPAWVREEMEITAHWVRAIQAEPKLWLRARLGQGEALAKQLGQTGGVSTTSDPVHLPDAVLYEGDEDLFRTPEFHAGDFEIQDIASQAVGVLCDPQPCETWWDACAGEGGKTLHLSDLMRNKGLIWASDRSAPRIQSFKRRAARAKCFNYRAVPWDGGAKLPTKTKFDGVLLDAPCSGLGTWQRNPHARWTTTPQDVRELAEVQKRLLLHTAAGVKPGGKLVYAVCTLTRAERFGVVDWFNGQANGFEPLELTPVAVPSPQMPAFVTLTLLPQEFGGNGMFVAVWRKTATAGV